MLFFNNCTEIKKTVLIPKNQKKCEYVTKINNWSAKALNISTSKDVKLQSHFKQPYNWSIYFMMEWLNFYCAIGIIKMKFAEHLGAHITPEWRKQYIQYEEMKAMLYESIQEAPSSEVVEPEVLTRYFAKFITAI